jgi:succinoglycan biosynthesis transport protein ExoP
MSTVPVYRTGVLDSAPIVTGEGDGSMTEYLEVHHYVRILYRRQWLILCIVAAGLGCAVLLNWITTPVFMAQATLQIDTDLNVLGVDRPLLPVDQRDWMREFLPTQLGILQSHELARAAHDDLMQSARSGGGVPTVPQIVAGRSVALIKDTRLVNVGFKSTDPKMAAQVANALAGAYVRQNLAFRSTANGDASDWLAKQVEQQRKLVNESENALQRYRQEQGADSLYAD